MGQMGRSFGGVMYAFTFTKGDEPPFLCSRCWAPQENFVDLTNPKPMPNPYKPDTTNELTAFTAEKDETAYLCVCKRTKNSPYCDKSHQNL